MKGSRVTRGPFRPLFFLSPLDARTSQCRRDTTQIFPGDIPQCCSRQSIATVINNYLGNRAIDLKHAHASTALEYVRDFLGDSARSSVCQQRINQVHVTEKVFHFPLFIFVNFILQLIEFHTFALEIVITNEFICDELITFI